MRALGVEQAFALGGRRLSLELDSPAFGDVAEHENHADDSPFAVADRRRVLVNRRSVPSVLTSTVGAPKATTFAVCEDAADRVASGPAAMFVEDVEDIAAVMPSARAVFQPVRRSATGFMNTTRPLTSVAMTASPMLASVMRNHACCASSSAAARFVR